MARGDSSNPPISALRLFIRFVVRARQVCPHIVLIAGNHDSAGRLDALSPLGVLGRGYSITLTDDGRAVRDAAEVQAGDAVRVRLHRGALACSVTTIIPGEE